MENMNIVNQIRFLPMSVEEFDTREKVINFLKSGLMNQGGKYYYRRKSIRPDGDILVLFQYAGGLIGSAIMISQANSERIMDGVHYNGYYEFDMNTMTVFASPITKEEYKVIDSSFKEFNQSTRKTNMAYYEDICNLIVAHE